MITRGLVLALGASQLVLWGVSYYLIAVFGEPIAAEMGWSRAVVWGGFSVSLLVQGLASRLVGGWIDRHGGRVVLALGTCLIAAGCAALAVTRDLASFYAAWALLGLAMRMALYDAAFATLARIGGPAARRPISQITLLGGLASSVLWPVGQALSDRFGWRGALLAYAGLALLTLPLCLTIPKSRIRHDGSAAPGAARPLAETERDRKLAGGFYAISVTLSAALNSAMSAHAISLLTGLGLAAGVAVWTATLRGVGQSAARLAEVLFGGGLGPLVLGVVASALLPVGFGLGLFSGGSILAALAFSLCYGAGNGLLTITRGTQPLILFDPAVYGALVGRLVAPSFFLSALSPICFAFVIERWGEAAALQLALALSVLVLLSGLALWWSFRNRPA